MKQTSFLKNVLTIGVLWGIFHSATSFAGHIFAFDFDQTLTRNHTFGKTKSGINPLEDVRGDIKAGTGDTLKAILNSGNHVAIATFHVREDVIKHYLTQAGLSAEELAQVKIVVRDEITFKMDNFKNPYIAEIISHFQKENNKVTGVTFYDDTTENVDSFEITFAGKFSDADGIEGVRVNKQNKDYVAHYQHVIDKVQALTQKAECHL